MSSAGDCASAAGAAARAATAPAMTAARNTRRLTVAEADSGRDRHTLDPVLQQARRWSCRRMVAVGLTAAAAGVTGGVGFAVAGRDSRPPARHDMPIPILVYHVLTALAPGAAYPELYVPSRDFAGEMRWLAVHHYHAITLRRAYAYWRFGRRLPRRPVVLTF